MIPSRPWWGRIDPIKVRHENGEERGEGQGLSKNGNFHVENRSEGIHPWTVRAGVLGVDDVGGTRSLLSGRHRRLRSPDVVLCSVMTGCHTRDLERPQQRTEICQSAIDDHYTHRLVVGGWTFPSRLTKPQSLPSPPLSGRIYNLASLLLAHSSSGVCPPPPENPLRGK